MFSQSFHHVANLPDTWAYLPATWANTWANITRLIGQGVWINRYAQFLYCSNVLYFRLLNKV